MSTINITLAGMALGIYSLFVGYQLGRLVEVWRQLRKQNRR